MEEGKTIRHLTETVIIPQHAKRDESSRFKRSKARLRKDGHYQCWVCGSTEELQVHHYGCSWSLSACCDFEKLKAFCEEWDVYGYGKLLKDKPMDSVDDIRNLLVLCREHHNSGASDGVANGIHNISFPAWVSQKVCIKGSEPIPQGD